MPGILFREVRAQIALAQVLDLLGFVPQEVARGELRGPCPVHRSAAPRSRIFSANLTKNVYRCFKCGSAGNQLDLYVAATGHSLFDAAIELCEKLHQPVPWIPTAQSAGASRRR